MYYVLIHKFLYFIAWEVKTYMYDKLNVYQGVSNIYWQSLKNFFETCLACGALQFTKCLCTVILINEFKQKHSFLLQLVNLIMDHVWPLYNIQSHHKLKKFHSGRFRFKISYYTYLSEIFFENVVQIDISFSDIYVWNVQ